MSWREWLDWFNNIISGNGMNVAAVLLSFLGAQCLAYGDRSKKAWGMTLSGIAISIAMGSLSFWVSQSLRTLTPIEGLRQPLPDNWGTQMDPAQREKSSRIYASLVYTGEGKIVKYVDQRGAWIEYCPTSEDASTIAQKAKVFADAQSAASTARGSAISWWASCAIALFIGAYFGQNKRRSA